jgi:phosphoribosylaminoimidazole (AIR) synthetase
MPEAALAKGCLESAGIEAFLNHSNMSRLEGRGIGMALQVRQEDAKIALELLNETDESDPESES